MQIIRKSVCLLAITIFILPYSSFALQVKMAENPHKALSILISEILYDPDPVVGLPAFEYLELYNKSRDTIDLLNWMVRVGDKKISLSSYIIYPDQYVVLSGNSGANEFSKQEIPVLYVEKWAALRNSGQFLALLSPEGDIIHFATYHPSQYNDALKKNGGWSLELADTDYPCSQDSWLPSMDPSGGTPGRKNSQSIMSDNQGSPLPLRVGIGDDQKLIVILDKPVLPLTNPDWFRFSIEPAGMQVESWTYLDDSPRMLELVLNESIPGGAIFSLNVDGDAEDCAGIDLKPGTLEFGLPEKPEPGDIVISELLFDPREDQVEFIGVHNLSDKILALNSLYFSICDEEGLISRFSRPAEESFLMFPGKEYVLTSDAYILRRMSALIPQGHICERSDIPALSNQGSILCLLDENQELLDKISYNPDWHDPNLDETKGISLERIHLDRDASYASNWHSASFISGSSTPGRLNSQRALQHNNADVFSIENQAFCPDQDGLLDFVLINISTPEPGWIGSAGVWNISGSRVKELSILGTLPTKGVIKWDGYDEWGNRVPSGYYVLILNYIRPDGSGGRWKDACVVTGY